MNEARLPWHPIDWIALICTCTVCVAIAGALALPYLPADREPIDVERLEHIRAVLDDLLKLVMAYLGWQARGMMQG